MARLRKECPWDAEQTHSSLVTYLIEETYELLEAIETSDFDSVEEELGDVLLQVLFHFLVYIIIVYLSKYIDYNTS